MRTYSTVLYILISTVPINRTFDAQGEYFANVRNSVLVNRDVFYQINKEMRNPELSGVIPASRSRHCYIFPLDSHPMIVNSDPTEDQQLPENSIQVPSNGFREYK